VTDAGERRVPSIPGYVLHTPLGRGAYGEVWLGENRTTKRQVAVKFLHSRATLDWWLLDGEIEKLAFLAADRRVVQLLDVGRDADPPFFVMEYIARGSLAQHLDSAGPLPVERAAAIFEEIALGLMLVHAKGILHCDLKPSNILLDDELRPRLADFGQSRPLDDRSPTLALGTMFFMAPEQADPAAVPDARWDVYALGAVLHTMLEGRPPHQSDAALAAVRAEPDLARRLARYRALVTAASGRAPSGRLDKPLARILARCLAVDPRARFSTVQEVVEALRLRREARARRPVLLLGGIGPVLLLAVMVVFGVRGYRQATEQSADAIRRRAFESNKYAAAFMARYLEGEIRRYLEVVTEERELPGFQTAFRTVTAMPDLPLLAAAGPDRTGRPAAALVEHFRSEPSRQALDAHFRARLDGFLAEWRRDPRAPHFVSMFALDAAGTHLGAAYDPDVPTKSVGGYFAWRSYFHGGPQDLPRDTPRARITPFTQPHLSAPFRSTTTNAWRLGVSAPLFDVQEDQPVFAGVLVLSVDIGNFDVLAVDSQPRHDRFAVLVDPRDGPGSAPEGARIILHPYFAEVAPPDPADRTRPAVRPFIDRQVLQRLTGDWGLAYQDPLGRAPGGAAFQGPWIAAAQPVRLPGGPGGQRGGDDGLVVMVQERAGAAIGPVVQLGGRLVGEGLLALAAVAVTVATLWALVLRGRPRRDRTPAVAPPSPDGPRALRDRSTLSESGPGHV
jgi:hypothetical protein